MKLYDVIRKEKLEKGIDIDHAETAPEPEKKKTKAKKKSAGVGWRKILMFGVALMLLCGLYVLGMKVVRAKVTVEERKIPFSLDNAHIELTHEKSAGEGRLSFQAMSVTTEITREVYGSVAKASTSKAKGNVVFFNEFSTSTQTIKKGTTLVGANGKRYVTQEEAKVPGYTTVNKVKKAGTSPSVSILATDTGATFNTDGTTFTVSAFSGTKAKQLYARSAGAITGGEIGAIHAVAESEEEAVIQTLESQLRERLKRETRAQIPNDLITFPDLQFITIEEAVTLEGNSIKFPVKVKGTMVSYLIPRDLLEASIAKRAISNHEYPRVSIPDLGDLIIEPVTAIPASTTSIPETITISVTGSATVITKVPAERIRELLIGVPRTDFTQVLAEVPEIDRAQFSLRPFWSPYFPGSSKHINVKVE